jgi:hypothetical protein
MLTANGIDITIRQLKGSLSIQKFDDTHCILFIEPGYMSVKMMGVFVQPGSLDGFNDALVLFEGGS